jgi:Fic family protein
VQRGVSGKYGVSRFGDLIRPFIPYKLPPNPSAEVSSSRQRVLERAMLSLGRLDGISLLLPAPDILLYTFVRREAVFSSQIKGNRSSLADLLLFELKETPGARFRDVSELAACVAALEHGLSCLRMGFPLSNRLIREMHQVLLARARRSVDPGEFRHVQNWVGGARPSNAYYVPPPPSKVENCMASLERFILDEHSSCPTLIKAGLAHVQFEIIHPFFGGNGRIGRMLVPLLIHPLLYMSLYFRDRKLEYHRLPDLVRAEGDWESWLDFFLEGVSDTASNAVSTSLHLAALFRDDANRIQAVARGASSALLTFQVMCERPITSLKSLCRSTALPFPTAANSINRLAGLGIVRELSGGRRNRVFAYDRCLAILDCQGF